MNDLEFERLARAAAGRVRAEADRIADSRSALASLLEREGPLHDAGPDPAAVPVLDTGPEPENRRWLPIVVAAATILAVGGVVLLARDDSGSVVSTTEPPAPDESTTVPEAPDRSDVVDTTAPADGPTTTEAATVAEPVERPAEESVTIPDEIGPQLDRTVLATFGFGDGPGELGFEDCQECEPLRPHAPVVADDGTIFVPDAYNERWQVFRDGTWTSVPFPDGEIAAGSPVVGPDGLLYARVAEDHAGQSRSRVVAYDPDTFEIVESYPGPMWTGAGVDLVSGSIELGGRVVHTPEARLGLATWQVDRTAHEVTIALSGVTRTFRLPDRWETDEAAAVPDDGSVVFHIWARNDNGPGDWFLLRLWADGTWATGSIGRSPGTTNLEGRFSRTGFVQLEDAIVEYALPGYVGPDPLAEWTIPEPAAPTLDGVPFLLPDFPVGTTLVRREYADAPALQRSFDQIWARADERGAVDAIVRITTWLDPRLPLDNGVAVEAAGWPLAYVVPTIGGIVSVRMHSATRAADVWSTGLEADDVVTAAAQLTVDASGVGWTFPDSLGENWRPVAAGWADGTAARTLLDQNGDRLAIEFTTASGTPAAVLTPFSGDGIVLTEVMGAPALLFDRGGVRAVTWSPVDGIVAVLGVRDTTTDVLALARSAAVVDPATWEAASVPNTSPADGCQSMFC